MWPGCGKSEEDGVLHRYGQDVEDLKKMVSFIYMARMTEYSERRKTGLNLGNVVGHTVHLA